MDQIKQTNANEDQRFIGQEDFFHSHLDRHSLPPSHYTPD